MNKAKQCKVKIIGATGYTGGDLIRLLLKHPQVEITSLTGAGIGDPKPLHAFWPEMRGLCPIQVTEETTTDPGGAEVVFLSTPHGVSMKLAPAYLDQGCKVIDLSADYRFKNLAEREGWYAGEHTSPELCQEAVYGMPELQSRDEIKKARLIANPGCYPTVAILSLYPAIKEGLIQPTCIHINSASGVTGAGKNPKLPFHHPELDQNFFAYRVGKHQHAPEIVSILREVTKKSVSASFVPHVLPIQRGILSTIYCQKNEHVSLQQIGEYYKTFYKDEPFIRIYELGEAPNLQAVRFTNFVDISVHEDAMTGEIIFVSAEDNLTKGAAGQAVQNMNIMMGFDETSGLL